MLLFSLAAFLPSTSAQQTDEVRFSVTVWDQPLASVLSEIEQQTGWTIGLQGPIKKTLVSGVYTNMTVSEFLAIALEDHDLSVSTDPETKRITISKRHDNTIAEQSQSRQEMARFLAREADHISKAKRSIKQPTQKERDALFNDPLTGKPWYEVDQEIGLSPKPNRASKPLSEAEFLAAESAYIEQAKQAVKDTPKSGPDGDNIDPISGKAGTK